MHYEFFGPIGGRRSVEMTEEDALRSIGERVANGFESHVRFLESPDGKFVTVVWFQSDVLGEVWAVYHD